MPLFPSRPELKCCGARQRALEIILNQLASHGLDIVYILGGDGTMKAAHALHIYGTQLLQQGSLDRLPTIIGVPKTMDNDVLWLWQSLGFQTAVATATG